MAGPIARGTIRTSFVLGMRLVVQAGTLVLVARMLGPDRFGAFAGATALAVVLGALSTFGTHLVLLGKASKKPLHGMVVMRYAIPTTLSCGIALLLIYLIACSTLLGHTQLPVHALVLIGAAETLLQPLLSFRVYELMGSGRVARSQLLNTLPLAIRLVAAFAILLNHSATPLIDYAIWYSAASVIALAPVAYHMPTPKRWRLPRRGELWGAVGYACLNITAFGPMELDKVLATRLLPLAASGLYAAGARVIGAATIPVIALMMSALPRLFRESGDQSKRSKHLFGWILATTASYGITLAAALWLLAPAIAWLFGPRYFQIQDVLHWLACVVPMLALRLAAGTILLGSNRPWSRAGVETLGLFVLCVTAAALAPRMEITGMALALIASESTMAFAGWALLARQLHRRDSKQIHLNTLR